MAGFGAIVAGAAKGYNQGYDERTRLELAARLEKEREERKIKMTPTETELVTGEDGVVYRQALNAYGETVGPRKALSDIEAKSLAQKQQMATYEMDKAGADVTRAKTEASRSILEEELLRKYGAKEKESALLTDQVQRESSRSNAANGAAYADQARAGAAAMRSEQDRKAQGIEMFMRSQSSEGPPTADAQANMAAFLVNPESAASNMTREFSPGNNKMALSRDNVIRIADNALQEIDRLTDFDKNPDAIDSSDARYTQLMNLRTSIVQAQLNDPNGEVLQSLVKRLEELQRGGSVSPGAASGSATSSIIDAALNNK